jgi:hypothetical protein
MRAAVPVAIVLLCLLALTMAGAVLAGLLAIMEVFG